MRPLPCLFMWIAIAGSHLQAVDSGGLFLTPGKTYIVTAARDIPLPGSRGSGDSSNETTVKIIRTGKDEWCWVEYDQWDNPPVAADGKSGPVTIYKKRVWFNFAQACTCDMTSPPNYARNFPGGFNIVVYESDIEKRSNKQKP